MREVKEIWKCNHCSKLLDQGDDGFPRPATSCPSFSIWIGPRLYGVVTDPDEYAVFCNLECFEAHVIANVTKAVFAEKKIDAELPDDKQTDGDLDF